MLNLILTLLTSLCLTIQGLHSLSNESITSDNQTTIQSFSEIELVANIDSEKMAMPVAKLILAKPSFSLFDNSIEMKVVSSATGFAIKYDKSAQTTYLLTNNHFCEDVAPTGGIILIQQSYQFGADDIVYGNEEPATVVATSPDYDLCLLSSEVEIKTAKLASSKYTPGQFEELYIVGAPEGTFPIIVKTYFSTMVERSTVVSFFKELLPDGGKYLLVSAQVRPGHSGSPIYNENREVIGIIFASISDYGGLGIPIADILIFLEENRVQV